jgi:hypothetical protein
MSFLVHLTPASRNVKTGPIPVSTTSAITCPTSCPFNNGNGCYAASGPLAIHWRKVTQGDRGDTWENFLPKIAALPKNQLWRMNAAGDLPGEGDTLDTVALGQLVQANKGKRGFTYTHKPLDTPHERLAIAHANANGFAVNLSGNTLDHADSLADMGIAPVTVVVQSDAVSNMSTPKGRKVVICPATIRDDVSCATCGLCAIVKRDCIVGFPAHGNGKRKVDAIVGP